MKHKIAVTVCVILIILTVGFIWNNSCQSVPKSQAATIAVAEKVDQIVTSVGNEHPVSSFKMSVGNIRKAAHAIEFFVLGVMLTVFAFVVKKRLTPQLLWNILSSALAIAVIDEAIQILSGRGPAVRDVLLDFCGALTGFLLTLLIEFIVSSCKKGKKKRAKN